VGAFIFLPKKGATLNADSTALKAAQGLFSRIDTLSFIKCIHYPVTMVFIVLEGAPCAGKTTLRKRLEKLKLSDRLFFLPTDKQVGEYVKEMPGYPRTYDQAKANEKWFLDQEVKKFTLVHKLAKAGHHIISERDYVSCLAFSNAYSKYSGINILDYTLSLYKQYLENGSLFRPDIRLILDVAPASMLIRNAQRKKKLSDFWLDNGFPSYLTDYFRYFAQNCENETSVLIRTEDNKEEEMLHTGEEIILKRLNV